MAAGYITETKALRGAGLCRVANEDAFMLARKQYLIVTEAETGIKLVQLLVVDHSKSALAYQPSTPKKPTDHRWDCPSG